METNPFGSTEMCREHFERNMPQLNNRPIYLGDSGGVVYGCRFFSLFCSLAKAFQVAIQVSRSRLIQGNERIATFLIF